MQIHLFSQTVGVLRAAQDDDQSKGDGGADGQGQAARGELE